MIDFIQILASVFQNVSTVETAVFLVYCFMGSCIFFLFKVWFPEYINSKRMEITRENKKAELLEATLKNISILLQSNTDAIQGFNKSIAILDGTLDKVSDKLHAHDARSQGLEDNIKVVATEMSRLKECSPKVSDIDRIDKRIDDFKGSVSDKQDVSIIVKKLDQILESVAEIKGKIL